MAPPQCAYLSQVFSLFSARGYYYKVTMTCWCHYLFSSMSLFLLGKYLGVESLGHMVDVRLRLLQTTKISSKWLYHLDS